MFKGKLYVKLEGVDFDDLRWYYLTVEVSYKKGQSGERTADGFDIYEKLGKLRI